MTLLVISCTLYAGDTLRVLFLGNSYTAVNNLPDVISKIAHASGDSLYYEVNAPGGYTFQQHSTDPTSLALIAQGNWDFVVLQEQSQRPSFEDAQVASEVYPYARKLDSLIHNAAGECARVMFYMTWGRKNGDASNCAVWPPICTYDGMDSLLQLRYNIMAEDNDNIISPVAKLWHYLRDNSPSIELYQADESHPSAAGTYAAAMSFYTMLFNKDPINNSFNYTLSASDANTIKAAARSVVYTQRGYWKRFNPWPHVDSISSDGNGGYTFHFTAVNPQNVIGYEWDFGDGSAHSYSPAPTHTYADNGTYTVCLTVSGTCGSLTICFDTTINITGIDERSLMQGVSVYPNPADDHIQIKGLTGKATYIITDALGVKVAEGEMLPVQNTVNVQKLASGIYFLSLSNQKGKGAVMKLVKQ